MYMNAEVHHEHDDDRYSDASDAPPELQGQRDAEDPQQPIDEGCLPAKSGLMEKERIEDPEDPTDSQPAHNQNNHKVRTATSSIRRNIQSGMAPFRITPNSGFVTVC